jgi:hypothetical protein
MTFRSSLLLIVTGLVEGSPSKLGHSHLGYQRFMSKFTSAIRSPILPTLLLITIITSESS